MQYSTVPNGLLHNARRHPTSLPIAVKAPEAERQQTQKLTEQLENARRAEEELELQRAQLERQLADVDTAARDNNANSPNLV
jgi:uncharacterized protein YlxW (UPF0749 family)